VNTEMFFISETGIALADLFTPAACCPKFLRNTGVLCLQAEACQVTLGCLNLRFPDNSIRHGTFSVIFVADCAIESRLILVYA
jgi:hypothetical protein